MNRRFQAIFIGTLLAVAPFAGAAVQGKQVTVTGWVVDSACAYTKGIAKPVSEACARACAKNGSPLVLLGDDGTIFIPISGETPAASQNAKLLPYAGKRVTMTGKDYVRNGSHGLVVENITKPTP
jgi:hypothetical protein